jgi:hypothetical protein
MKRRPLRSTVTQCERSNTLIKLRFINDVVGSHDVRLSSPKVASFGRALAPDDRENGGPMERRTNGDFVIDADKLTRRFGLRTKLLRKLMRRELVSGRVEIG